MVKKCSRSRARSCKRSIGYCVRCMRSHKRFFVSYRLHELCQCRAKPQSLQPMQSGGVLLQRLPSCTLEVGAQDSVRKIGSITRKSNRRLSGGKGEGDGVCNLHRGLVVERDSETSRIGDVAQEKALRNTQSSKRGFVTSELFWQSR